MHQRFQVDVIFEEDKGFLSAIQNFMSNTKIPIILTTSDPGFSSVFDGRFEHYSMKKPTLVGHLSFTAFFLKLLKKKGNYKLWFQWRFYFGINILTFSCLPCNRIFFIHIIVTCWFSLLLAPMLNQN